jgi:hypothetical protein
MRLVTIQDLLYITTYKVQACCDVIRILRNGLLRIASAGLTIGLSGR